MRVFYHHVGQRGASDDFPKTVFRPVTMELVQSAVDPADQLGQLLLRELATEFPGGSFNCWGVPDGANVVIQNLAPGDAVFLVESVHQGGSVPAMAPVRVYLNHELRRLSQALWQDEKYPHIFFFETERLNLSWMQFIEYLGYKSNFDPRGKFYSIAEAKLLEYGGARNFVSMVRERHATGGADRFNQQVSADVEAQAGPEAQPVLSELHQIVSRSEQTDPALTEPGSRVETVVVVQPRSEAFRIGVQALYQGACVVCGLCLRSRAGGYESQSAHIYPKSLDGSDDLRNGLCLCRLHHWAFDVGWMTLTDELRVLVGEDVPADEGYDLIRRFHDQPILAPLRSDFKPHHVFVQAHRRLHGFLPPQGR